MGGWLVGRGWMDDGWEGMGGWMEGDGWRVGWKVTDGYIGWRLVGWLVH